jgi:hypothetical protein
MIFWTVYQWALNEHIYEIVSTPQLYALQQLFGS